MEQFAESLLVFAAANFFIVLLVWVVVVWISSLIFWSVGRWILSTDGFLTVFKRIEHLLDKVEQDRQVQAYKK